MAMTKRHENEIQTAEMKFLRCHRIFPFGQRQEDTRGGHF